VRCNAMPCNAMQCAVQCDAIQRRNSKYPSTSTTHEMCGPDYVFGYTQTLHYNLVNELKHLRLGLGILSKD
jgi:hypothetical protein